jgi:hypothetical protein
VALRADALLAGRAWPLAARGRAALLAHDRHLRRHSLHRRQARLEAWRENDRGFRPSAFGGGASPHEGHVARGWSLSGALGHGGRGGWFHALQRRPDDHGQRRRGRGPEGALRRPAQHVHTTRQRLEPGDRRHGGRGRHRRRRSRARAARGRPAVGASGLRRLRQSRLSSPGHASSYLWGSA